MKRILVTIATTLLAVASLAAKDYKVSTPNSMLVLTGRKVSPSISDTTVSRLI